jgi:hypothetical protein
METVAYNFHDEDGSVFKNIDLKAGDDAKGVKWTDFIGLDGLYANHLEFIRKTVEFRNAYLKINYGNIMVSIPFSKNRNKHTNKKCRSRDSKELRVYMKDPHEIKRPCVPDEYLEWTKDYPDYKPIKFTMKYILETPPVWADKQDFTKIKWNTLDNNVDRTSHLGTYQIVNGCARNPIGRTGIIERGQLGRWGPNHAADPVVTRWKRDEYGNKMKHKDKFILQFVSIKRIDTGEWAIPGVSCFLIIILFVKISKTSN